MVTWGVNLQQSPPAVEPTACMQKMRVKMALDYLAFFAAREWVKFTVSHSPVTRARMSFFHPLTRLPAMLHSWMLAKAVNNSLSFPRLQDRANSRGYQPVELGKQSCGSLR